MTFLVDANVLSEATKPDPGGPVAERETTVDPIVLGEIRFAIHLLPAGARRRRLEEWFSQGVARIFRLPWQAETGLRWARLLRTFERLEPPPARRSTPSWAAPTSARSSGASPPGNLPHRPRFTPWAPEISEENRKLRWHENHVSGAKSVIRPIPGGPSDQPYH